MKKIVFSDCHWGGDDPSTVDQEFGASVIYIGDNHEFKNVAKSRLRKLELAYANFLERAASSNTTVIAGNHEVSYGSYMCQTYSHVEENVLYVHGHRLSYSDGKARKWETRGGGRSKFGRALSKLLSKARRLIPKKGISKKVIREAIWQAGQRGCNTIVFGHTHVGKVTTVERSGVRVINVPRGRSEIDV